MWCCISAIRCSCCMEVLGLVITYDVKYQGIFFFKQKTAYELRISDWSSDVCSSDLQQTVEHLQFAEESGLTHDVAMLCEVSFLWLSRGEGLDNLDRKSVV